MLKALIALRSDDVSSVLMRQLASHYSVRCCHDGIAALGLLQEIRPDILILDLSLPELDGITLLERAADFRPPIVLAILDVDNHYVRGAAADVGIGYMMMLPSNLNILVTRLLDMVSRHGKTVAKREETQTLACQILLELGLRTNRDGYLYLQAALPIFAEDPTLHMGKELYSHVGKLLGVDSTEAIERSIRTVIENAWKRRDPKVWDVYFPPGTVTRAKGPSNKLFISRMAEELNRR